MPSKSDSGDRSSSSTSNGLSFYDILGVSPLSSQSEIRDAYRRKSKQFHPDTTLLDKQDAARRFQSLKHAYETLRFPDKRRFYDDLLAKKCTSHAMRSPAIKISPPVRSSASLDPEDRVLSAGEVFALFILGITFLFCLLVAIFLGISRGEMIVQSIPQDSSLLHQIESIKPILNQPASETRDPSQATKHKKESRTTQPSNARASANAPDLKSKSPLFPPAPPH